MKNVLIYSLLTICFSCTPGDHITPQGNFEVFALDNGRVVISSNFTMEEGTKLRWDFGDGSKPIDETAPSQLKYYDYKKNGTFKIQCSYWGTNVVGQYSDGSNITEDTFLLLNTKTITIGTAKGIAALFVYQIDATNKLKVTFTNQSQFADKYIWKFGDGSESTDQNPSHTYAKAGKYTVTLAAIHNNEADTFSQILNLN